MVLFDQPVFAFVYFDFLASDQVLDVCKKHVVVRFHLGCRYKKVKVKKVGCSNSLAGFLTMLVPLV